MTKKSFSQKILTILSNPQNFSQAVLTLVIISDILVRFLNPKIGKIYRIGMGKKLRLLRQMMKIDRQIPTGTNWIDAVLMAIHIFQIPPQVKGEIIECGAWKGASTARFSLIAKLVHRRLIVADSFEGLPADENVVHQYPHAGIYGYYQKGMYRTGLLEVKSNIEKYGDLASCDFLVGFYEKSLKKIQKPIVFAFLDVDLASSTYDCIRYIWPKMYDLSYIFTDDACDMEVVKVWFDRDFWQTRFKQTPPGYVGSGCGLPTSARYSGLGYARKIKDPKKSYDKISWLVYPKKGKKKAKKWTN